MSKQLSILEKASDALLQDLTRPSGKIIKVLGTPCNGQCCERRRHDCDLKLLHWVGL